jgi:D-aspartate ligase
MPAPEHHAELEPLTSAFFDAVQFTGIGSMEFKRDARTGRMVMIEPTVGRTDWQEEIATLNGVNIPLAAYLDALGAPQPSSAAPSTPVIWRDSLPCFQSLLRTGPSRQPLDGERRARRAGVAWRRDDPWPAVYFLIKWLRKLPRRSAWAATFGKGGHTGRARALPVPAVR